MYTLWYKFHQYVSNNKKVIKKVLLLLDHPSNIKTKRKVTFVFKIGSNPGTYFKIVKFISEEKYKNIDALPIIELIC